MAAWQDGDTDAAEPAMRRLRLRAIEDAQEELAEAKAAEVSRASLSRLHTR